jgi:diadenosine tetraphosphate (Ap4A) HIT family hydrolase
MFVNDCDFCQEFQGYETWLDQALLRRAGLTDRILLRKNGVVSLVGVGPITSGYVLILPEAHYYSIGAVSEDILAEITSQKQQIVDLLQREFGSAICFEHGAISSTERGGACVDHAHLHVIPGCENFRKYVDADFDGKIINNLSELKRFVVAQYPYLYLEDTDGSKHVYALPIQVPSQYFRQVWAKAVGQPDAWDWALFPNYELMRQTFDVLGGRLRSAIS